MSGPFDQIVSLGRACQVACQLRRVTGDTSARALDWVITSDEALLRVLGDGLSGWFRRENLAPFSPGFGVDLATGIRFQHEFAGGVTVDAAHAAHAGRMAELAQRWGALMAGRGRVLFVRQDGWSADVPRHAATLRDALGRAAPGLTAHLLYLTETARHDPAWAAPGITFQPLSQTEPYDWRGDDAAWDRALAAVGVGSG